jgi:hypothetical protein
VNVSEGYKNIFRQDMKMQPDKEDKNKQAYEKPKLRSIELAAEETLAVGCKIAPGRPGQSSPIGCGTAACSLKSGS